MTKEKKIIVIMAIISILVIAILSYFLINKNAIIEKQAEKIELQAMEINGSNSYVTTEDHLNEISQKSSSTNYRVVIQGRAGIDGANTGAYNTAYFDIINGVATSPVSTASGKDWSNRVTCAVPLVISVEKIEEEQN